MLSGVSEFVMYMHAHICDLLTVSECVFGTLKVHAVRSWRGYVFAVHGQTKVAVWK